MQRDLSFRIFQRFEDCSGLKIHGLVRVLGRKLHFCCGTVVFLVPWITYRDACYVCIRSLCGIYGVLSWRASTRTNQGSSNLCLQGQTPVWTLQHMSFPLMLSSPKTPPALLPKKNKLEVDKRYLLLELHFK